MARGRVPSLGTGGSQNFPLGQLSAGVEGYFTFMNMVPDYHDLVVSLVGNPGTANAVAMAGAREAAKWAKKYADEMADNPTGRMSSSIRARGRKTNPRIRVTDAAGNTRWRNKFEGEPNRTEGSRITVNRKGSYEADAGRKGGVRYGTPVHQGRVGKDRIWPARPFLYDAVDKPEARAAAIKAMSRQWDRKVLPRLVARAKVLEGHYGRAAERELRQRMMRAGDRLSPGRFIGGGPSAADRIGRAQIRNRSLIQHLANDVVNDLQDDALRSLKLNSLAGRTL